MIDQYDFERLETKVDKVVEGVSDLKVAVEHRLTKVEVRTGLWGIVGGAIVTAVSAFIGYPKH